MGHGALSERAMYVHKRTKIAFLLLQSLNTSIDLSRDIFIFLFSSISCCVAV